MHIDDRVIFIHNPRTAGTSTRRALLHGKDPNKDIPYPGNVATPWTRNQKHMFAGVVKAKLPDIWDSRFKFSIVRHPLDRLVSIYGLFRRLPMPMHASYTKFKLNKMVASLVHPRVSEDMPKDAKRKLCDHAFSLGFKDWLLNFCEEYRWNGCRYLHPTMPLTRIQQVSWFDGLDRVFRFEDLDELYDWLSDMGYSLPVPENQTKHEPWESYYDTEMRDWAEAVFCDDIDRFGY